MVYIHKYGQYPYNCAHWIIYIKLTQHTCMYSESVAETVHSKLKWQYVRVAIYLLLSSSCSMKLLFIAVALLVISAANGKKMLHSMYNYIAINKTVYSQRVIVLLHQYLIM